MACDSLPALIGRGNPASPSTPELTHFCDLRATGRSVQGSCLDGRPDTAPRFRMAPVWGRTGLEGRAATQTIATFHSPQLTKGKLMAAKKAAVGRRPGSKNHSAREDRLIAQVAALKAALLAEKAKGKVKDAEKKELRVALSAAKKSVKK